MKSRKENKRKPARTQAPGKGKREEPQPDLRIIWTLTKLRKRKPGKAADGWAGLHGFLKHFRDDLSEPSCAGDRQGLAKLHRILDGPDPITGKMKNRSPLDADLGPGRGRPRNEDEDRKTVRQLHDSHTPWKDIVAKMEEITGRKWTVDACRALLRNR